MSAIVQHYGKKTGKIWVYESAPHYDPITKQSRPKRKYLGTFEPETEMPIPFFGRQGRTSSSKNDATTEDNPASAKITDLQRTIFDKDKEIDFLKSEVRNLKAAVKSYPQICASISDALAKAPHEL